MKTLIRITLFFSLALGIVLFFLPKHEAKSWGFYGHKKINRMAVFTLPPEMLGFYKNTLNTLQVMRLILICAGMLIKKRHHVIISTLTIMVQIVLTAYLDYGKSGC